MFVSISLDAFEVYVYISKRKKNRHSDPVSLRFWVTEKFSKFFSTLGTSLKILERGGESVRPTPTHNW